MNPNDERQIMEAAARNGVAYDETDEAVAAGMRAYHAEKRKTAELQQRIADLEAGLHAANLEIVSTRDRLSAAQADVMAWQNTSARNEDRYQDAMRQAATLSAILSNVQTLLASAPRGPEPVDEPVTKISHADEAERLAELAKEIADDQGAQAHMAREGIIPVPSFLTATRQGDQLYVTPPTPIDVEESFGKGRRRSAR